MMWDVEKLGETIRKRLGKKANAIWKSLANDLYAIDILKNHIQRRHYIAVKPPKEVGDYNSIIESCIDYYASKMREDEIQFLTQWLKENIDKESLRKWLDEDETK